MIDFKMFVDGDPRDLLGYIPLWLSEHNLKTAVEQLDAGYCYGGGWRDFHGFEMTDEGLVYPGDRPMRLIGEARLREEIIRIYEMAWVAVIQPDGSFVVSRMD